MHDAQQCRFRNEVADFAGNGDILRRHVMRRKRQKEQVLEKVYSQETTLKELEGDSESEEGDRLQWGSLHGLAEDKRKGMKQWKTGKPMYMEVIVNKQPL